MSLPPILYEYLSQRNAREPNKLPSPRPERKQLSAVRRKGRKCEILEAVRTTANFQGHSQGSAVALVVMMG